jgi:hypothetical protein
MNVINYHSSIIFNFVRLEAPAVCLHVLQSKLVAENVFPNTFLYCVDDSVNMELSGFSQTFIFINFPSLFAMAG